MCNPIHHCCRCSRTFPEGFRYSDPGCSGNVSTYHVITVISLYKNQVVRHRCRTSGYDGYQFCLRAKYAGIAGEYDIATILGAQIVGGIVALLVGLNIKRIRKFFPPLITGTVVFAIGLSLYPTAINYMAGGASSENYGSWQNWLVAVITLIIVTFLNHYGKGIWKLASILIGIIGGYIVSLCFGMIDFSSVSSASFFQLPKPMHFGITFEPSSCVAIAILFAINAVQAIGDFSATTTGAMDRMPTDKELTGGIVGYGISNIISAFFGGLPTATYSQNVGIVSTTKVTSRRVMGTAAVILLAAGLIPKFHLYLLPYLIVYLEVQPSLYLHP